MEADSRAFSFLFTFGKGIMLFSFVFKGYIMFTG